MPHERPGGSITPGFAAVAAGRRSRWAPPGVPVPRVPGWRSSARWIVSWPQDGRAGNIERPTRRGKGWQPANGVVAWGHQVRGVWPALRRNLGALSVTVTIRSSFRHLVIDLSNWKLGTTIPPPFCHRLDT